MNQQIQKKILEVANKIGLKDLNIYISERTRSQPIKV